MRITVSVTEAASHRQLWAERYDRELADLFAVQDEIADRIVTELDVQLVEGEQARMRRRGTNSVEAWRQVKQGHALLFFTRTPEAVALAVETYRRAADADPAYAFPVRMMVMARCHELEWGYRAVSPESLAELEQWAERARELDPAAAGNQGVSARIHITRREFDEAIACARAAMAAEPHHADLMGACGWYLLLAGQTEDALKATGLAVRHGSGRGVVFKPHLCLIHYAQGDYGKAFAAAGYLPLTHGPMDFHWPFAIAAAVAVGELAAARARTTAYREYDPDGSLCRRALDALPFRDRSVIERLRAHLSEVGLP